MKLILSIFLILGISAQPCSNLIIVVDYLLNEEYITRNFCENKTRPEMQCHGKCHLNKQLQAQNKQTHPEKSVLKELKEILPFTPVSKSCLAKLPCFAFNAFAPVKSVPYSSFHTSIFHPPTC